MVIWLLLLLLHASWLLLPVALAGITSVAPLPPFSSCCCYSYSVVIIYVLLSVDQSVGACFFTHMLTHTHTDMETATHLFYDRMNILCMSVCVCACV